MRVFEYPNPALKQCAASVEPGDEDVRRLVKSMMATMREAPGVGLAATQVGVQKRVIVFDPDEEGEARALLNPVILDASGQTCVEEEGCLSFPGIVVSIERPAVVVCEGLDPDGEPVVLEAEDLLARVLQHEIDHLDGLLIIDRADQEERQAALRRYRELHEE